MRVAVIDCGSGNLRSVTQALERVGEGRAIAVTTNPSDLSTAERIILPGVGAFADCMRGLLAIPGMKAALEQEVLQRGKKFLGICVGMQMLFTRSHEHGAHKGLGWIAGEVRAIEPAGPRYKIPHMGWNELHLLQSHPLFTGIEEGSHAYFVHSYEAKCEQESDILADTEYGGRIVAAVGRDNIAGTQFHPEKSQETGLRLLENFLNWN